MFFARKVSVFTILSYVFSVGFVFAADTTVTSKQYVDNQLLKKINLETGAGISAGDMLRATVDTNDANKMKWLAWTPDYITNSVLTTRLADYQPKINSISTSGTGNFVTGVTALNGVITATKGDVPDATATTKGIAKMYGSLGSNTDGSMTQKAIRDALKDKVDLVIADDAMALISRDGNGTAVKATSDDVSVANDGSFIVKHATIADSANTAGSVPWAGVTGAPTIPTDISTNKVNGAPLSNVNTYYYGSGTGANTTVAKAVSIPSITSAPTEGMVIVVKPVATSSAANPTLNLNNTGAVRIKYNNSTTITSTDSGKIWKSGVPSIFVYDGANWVFAGNDTDTKYTFATGGTAGAFSVTPDGTNTQTVYINGWANKQDTISDLATIRSGASAGATAVQPDDLAAVATSGNYNDLTNKPAIPSVPTNVGDFTNNVNYIKRSNSTNAVGSATQPVYVNASGVATATTYTLGASVPAGAVFTDSVTTVTNSDGTAGGNTAAAGSIKVTKDGTTTYPVVQGWANKQDTISDLATIRSGASAGATAVQPDDLAPVATSGNYNDLTNKPAIPSVPTNVGDFTNNVNYIKRSNGTNAVGSATQPVYVNASGVATATTYTLGASVPAGAVFTDSVTTVTNSDGSAGGSQAADGSIKVTKDGTTTYPVVQGWANKQDTISDLATIRSGASAGATAVQPDDLAPVATSGNYNDLTNKPAIPTLPSAAATGQLLQATVSNETTTWSAFTPSYATTGDLSAKVDTTVAGDANSLMIRNTSGVATKPTSSDVTVSGTTVTIANSAVTSAKIADETIMNADVASNAAIAQSKIANLTTDLAAKVPIAQGTGNANKALVVDSSGNVTSGAVKVPITDFSGTGGWAAMWID